jgi:ADP-ribosylglycohydrolase
MIGAIAGEIMGSVYERWPLKTISFPLFSDRCCFTGDTVLMVVIAEAILTGRSYRQSFIEISRMPPHAGYSGSFIQWLHSDNPEPQYNWGNGAAMRVSPVGFVYQSEEDVLLNT